MSKLTNILEDMIVFARSHAGQNTKRHLHNGLTLEVRAPLSTEIRVTISREDKYPSMEEWRTIIAHIPYPIMETAPELRQAGRCYTMTARLPLPRAALMKM